MTDAEARARLDLALVDARLRTAGDQRLLEVVRVWCRGSVLLVYVARGEVAHQVLLGYN